jgi:hypothetical protein
MSFLAYYMIMLGLSLIANYFIQGPQRLIDEEERITN